MRGNGDDCLVAVLAAVIMLVEMPFFSFFDILYLYSLYDV